MSAQGRPASGWEIRTNVIFSQEKLHRKYGGVVPEVAARRHVETIMPVIEKALKRDRPDLIAVTRGPGLITSLQVGLQTARALAYVWNVPLIGVNHLEAHLWSFLLNSKSQILNPKQIQNLKFKIQNLLPAVALIVSGGHTELILVKGAGKYKLIGQTRDDAAGEAFDKVAKMLELGYPGGPIISHFAEAGNPDRIKLPRPMIDSADFDFSFSGLKTAVKYLLAEITPTGSLSQAFINDVCAGFQQAAVEVLVSKTLKAVKKYKAKSLIIGGGVSANQKLISTFKSQLSKLGLDFYYPDKEFTGDNAAMIALAGFLNKKRASRKNWRNLTAEANLNIAV